MRHFRQVYHPGTRPHPYIEEGGYRSEPFIKDEFDKAAERVFDGEGLRT
jgi:hypothetical protein